MAITGLAAAAWISLAAPAELFGLSADVLTGATLALLAAALLLLRRAQRRLDRGARAAAEAAALQAEMVDRLDIGLAVYDRDDRLLRWNREFARLYASAGAEVRTGRCFEDLLRDVVAHGHAPQAQGDPEAWIQARLRARREPSAPLLREMPDGRWRRISELRLADGKTMSYSVDVTELVRKEQERDAAGRAAEQAVARLEDAIEALPAGFELYDADDRLVLCNSTLRRMQPLAADLIPQRPTFEERIRAAVARGGLPAVRDHPGGIDAWIAQRQRARRRDSGEAVLLREGERWIRLHERATREGGVVGVRIDVTETLAQTHAAEQARARLHDAIEALPDGFVLFDADDRLVLCNTRFRELYAAAAPLLTPGTRFEDIVRYGLERGQYPQALGREEAWLAERMQAHREPRDALLQELPGNRWLQIVERPTHDGGVAGVRSDVTEFVRRQQQLSLLNDQLDAANAQLAALSDTDALTGIANRRRFDRALAEEGARAARHGLPLAVLMIDVDHFKPYNDRHGHVAGDDALRRVAALLAGCARRPGDLVARYGGEEFVLLLPHASAEEALATARLCLATVDEAAIPHGASPVAPHVTLSIGVQAWGPGGAAPDTQTLVQGADAAMYAAKSAGRHGVHLN